MPSDTSSCSLPSDGLLSAKVGAQGRFLSPTERTMRANGWQGSSKAIGSKCNDDDNNNNTEMMAARARVWITGSKTLAGAKIEHKKLSISGLLELSSSHWRCERLPNLLLLPEALLHWAIPLAPSPASRHCCTRALMAIGHCLSSYHFQTKVCSQTDIATSLLNVILIKPLPNRTTKKKHINTVNNRVCRRKHQTASIDCSKLIN